MRNTYIYQLTSDLKKDFFVNNLKSWIIINIKNIDHNYIIKIRIIFIFQRKFKTIVL